MNAATEQEAVPLIERVGKFSVVRRAWEGETVLCVAGGPSVTPQIVAAAKGRCRAIAVNNSYEICPWAEALYFADFGWWRWHCEKPAYKAFAGAKITIDSASERVTASEPAVHVLRNGGSSGLSEKTDAINTGSNSGYQAMNIAFLAGAKKILLLGYDMRFVNKKSHWHGDHPVKTHEVAYSRYAKRFQSVLPQVQKAGVDVVNCSPGSLIGYFRFSTVEAELA